MFTCSVISDYRMQLIYKFDWKNVENVEKFWMRNVLLINA